MPRLLTTDLGPDGSIVPPKDHSHLTSAFEDFILIPLASWFFLLLLTPTLLYTIRRNRHAAAFTVEGHRKHSLR